MSFAGNLAKYDDDFRTAVSKGVCKVNIFTDIDKAGRAGVEAGLAAGAEAVRQCGPRAKQCK